MAQDTTVVYLIAEFYSNDEPTDYCKVGKSTQKQMEEENRLRNLQTGNPRRLKTLLCYPVSKPFDVEKYMTEKAKKHRIILPPTSRNQLSPEAYPERKTEWYKIDGRSLEKFFRDFTAAVQACQ